MKNRRRWIWLGVGLVVLIIAIFAARSFVQNNAQSTDAADANEIVTAFIGDLSASASASGKVVAQRDARISLEVGGTVDRVYVRIGDEVKAGDPLLKLDTAALERSVSSAEQNLIIQVATLSELVDGASFDEIVASQESLRSAEANLADVRDGADPNEIAAAQANLNAAQETYQELQNGPTENTLTQAAVRLRNAEASLNEAQAAYDQVAWRNDVAALPQSSQLQRATIEFEAAQSEFNVTADGASFDQLEQARANVAQAQLNLQNLLNKPTEAELASAISQAAQARSSLQNLIGSATEESIASGEAQVMLRAIALQEAQESLQKATLRAPFDGMVTEVHFTEGEQANGLAVEMVDPYNLEVELEVDEIDFSELAVGQPARLTFDALLGVEVESEIRAIAPKASGSTGSDIVTYRVILSLDAPDQPIRAGMTANANLITAKRDGVLLVPNRTITADRQLGTFTVNVVTGSGDTMEVQAVEVQTGLRDREFTQITSGLSEGERLLIGDFSAPRRRFGPGGGDGPPRNN